MFGKHLFFFVFPKLGISYKVTKKAKGKTAFCFFIIKPNIQTTHNRTQQGKEFLGSPGSASRQKIPSHASASSSTHPFLGISAIGL